MQGSSQSSSAIQLHPAASSKNSATSCRHCNAHRVLQAEQQRSLALRKHWLECDVVD